MSRDMKEKSVALQERERLARRRFLNAAAELAPANVTKNITGKPKLPLLAIALSAGFVVGYYPSLRESFKEAALTALDMYTRQGMAKGPPASP